MRRIAFLYVFCHFLIFCESDSTSAIPPTNLTNDEYLNVALPSFKTMQRHLLRMYPLVDVFCCQQMADEHAQPRVGRARLTKQLQFISSFGYPSEGHVIETADGYLIDVHRIPHGKFPVETNEVDPKQKIPVLLHHGLLGCSADYVIAGPNRSMAFLLADMGYDVWMGNSRGSTYSKAHVKWNPHQREFWNYSWHDSAIYDLPAEIDYILNITQQEQIIYMGYSMGTTLFFAMASTLPEYNNKIALALQLAPIAYLDHMRSPLIRVLSYFSMKIEFITNLLTHGEFLPKSEPTRVLQKFLCSQHSLTRKLCMSTIFLVVGSDPEEFDLNLLNSFANFYPAGYSIKGVIHYVQIYRSGKFRQYDYGKAGNMLQYGTENPPEYNLSNIKAPMYFYVGKNDYLSTVPDVERLAKQLPSLKDVYIVDYEKFSHLDFIISLDIHELLYDRVLHDLTSSVK